MNHRVFSLVLSLCSLTGCSALKVSGLPGADPVPEATEAKAPAESGGSTGESSAQLASDSKAKEPEKSKCELEAEQINFFELQNVSRYEGGELTITDALEGISPEKLTTRIKAACSKLGQEPSAAVLAEAEALRKRERDGAVAAVTKWGEKRKSAVASKDAAAEKAITDDFLKWHEGAEIKRVVLTDADWKQNYNGLVVRNRYKNAQVLIAVKGETFCLAVPANAAQASTGTGFEKAYKHDVYDKGHAVPCD